MRRISSIDLPEYTLFLLEDDVSVGRMYADLSRLVEDPCLQKSANDQFAGAYFLQQSGY
jgi:hypothetical protein